VRNTARSILNPFIDEKNHKGYIFVQLVDVVFRKSYKRSFATPQMHGRHIFSSIFQTA